jgi:hypothetical protein
MATFYREQVTALHLALGDAEGADRAEAAERLRSLVSKIVLTPEHGRLAIDLHGDLAGILAIAHENGPNGTAAQAKPNTGNRRGQHSFQKHKGRPWGTADVAEIAQQVKLVAGERNQLYATPRGRVNAPKRRSSRGSNPLGRARISPLSQEGQYAISAKCRRFPRCEPSKPFEAARKTDFLAHRGSRLTAAGAARSICASLIATAAPPSSG